MTNAALAARPQHQRSDRTGRDGHNTGPPLRLCHGVFLEDVESPAEPIEVAIKGVARTIYCGFELMRSFIHSEVSFTVCVVRGSVAMVLLRRRPAISAANPAIPSTTPTIA
jgi:hypothetical protein